MRAGELSWLVQVVARWTDIPHVENLQAVLDLLWKVLDVLAVLGRQQHRLDAGPQRANQLLLDAADGRDAAAEGYFALEEGKS